jgi:hypothetical protein
MLLRRRREDARPLSIARELPDTGGALIVDRKAQEIIWQQGVKGVQRHLPGYLCCPDGCDTDVYRD